MANNIIYKVPVQNVKYNVTQLITSGTMLPAGIIKNDVITGWKALRFQWIRAIRTNDLKN